MKQKSRSNQMYSMQGEEIKLEYVPTSFVNQKCPYSTYQDLLNILQTKVLKIEGLNSHEFFQKLVDILECNGSILMDINNEYEEFIVVKFERPIYTSLIYLIDINSELLYDFYVPLLNEENDFDDDLSQSYSKNNRGFFIDDESFQQMENWEEQIEHLKYSKNCKYQSINQQPKGNHDDPSLSYLHSLAVYICKYDLHKSLLDVIKRVECDLYFLQKVYLDYQRKQIYDEINSIIYSNNLMLKRKVQTSSQLIGDEITFWQYRKDFCENQQRLLLQKSNEEYIIQFNKDTLHVIISCEIFLLNKLISALKYSQNNYIQEQQQQHQQNINQINYQIDQQQLPNNNYPNQYQPNSSTFNYQQQRNNNYHQLQWNSSVKQQPIPFQ